MMARNRSTAATHRDQSHEKIVACADHAGPHARIRFSPIRVDVRRTNDEVEVNGRSTLAALFAPPTHEYARR
jgi:hypothetical protein